MKTLFIPKIIHVGYQNRRDTYTEKLAYVIYTDEKGKKRKETSWEGWRNKEIESDDFENIPTEGFVLNKKVGGYKSHWNFRNSYVRIYDPRGFEFEITVENLLFILENTSSIIGKGLEGKFIYSWDGKELVLLPVNSQNYIESTKYTEQLTTAKKIGARDMEIGKVYLDKSLQRHVFLGRKKGYSYDYVDRSYKISKGKLFWFLRIDMDAEITEEDVNKLLEVYDNRKKNIAPFEISFSESKGSIESFSGISSKFIQMDEIDALALAYGELLLKDDILYNKDIQERKRKPITLDELNMYLQGIGIKNGEFNSTKASFIPFSFDFIERLKENNIRINSLKNKHSNLETCYFDSWKRDWLDFAHHYYHGDKEFTQYEQDDIFEALTFSLEYKRNVWTYNSKLSPVDFTQLDFLLNESDITWVEANGNDKLTIVNEFEKNQSYLGVRIITVQEVLENLEIEELYHNDHLVRKGIVNK